MDGGDGLAIQVLGGLGDVDPAEWDAIAGTDNPFITHAFLFALEQSGSVSAKAGWMPQHLAVRDTAGKLVACAPLYLKSHSQGEYVFDHGWAGAFERAGGRYYPKLLGAVPFTPVTGPRLLAPTMGERRHLALGIMALAREADLSSAHLTFVEPGDAKLLKEMGFLLRTDRQFHWQNEGYGDFGGFLDALTSRKRKTIRRERRDALGAGTRIEILTGADILELHWDHFYEFYLDTGSRKWGSPYLTRQFFSLIGETMADAIVLFMAKREGRYIAGALNFKSKDCLWGRNWGAIEYHPFLHFELCYYQAIDYAIQEGLNRVEAGVQGEHKLVRGYMPVETYSAHYIRNDGFRAAVHDFLREEGRAVDRDIEILEGFGPFKGGE